MASFDSTYNLAGEVASESDYQVGLDSSLSDPVVSDYAYDSQGQVTQDGTGSYAYSGTNRSTKTVGIATTSYTTANDQLTTDGTWNYFYDAAGNQVKKVNILSTDPDYGKAWKYTFNYENQLISAKEYSSDPDVSGSSPTLLTEVDYVYDVYGNRIQTSTGGGAAYVAPVETTEYANSVVTFSSQYSSTSWSAAQATGAPNVTGTQHDDANAWAALAPNNATEYLELGYATAINVDSVTITESDDAGFVTEIDLIEPDGTSHSFTGIVDSSSSSGAIVDFTYTLSSETSYPVDKVKIVINGLHTTGWEEIDAVQIHGYTPAVGTFDDPVVTKYALDGWNPAKSNPVGNEDTSVWADINGDGSLATHYMLGDQVDQILARVDVTAPSDSTTGAKWYLTDQQGSLRTLLDASGSEIVSLRYDAFGNVTAVDSAYSSDPMTEVTDIAGRYQWTGREKDAETGLQYNRARWYDAGTGRWISQDPMGFDAGDSNLYRYARNAPTVGDDPSGLQDTEVTDATFERQLFNKKVSNPVAETKIPITHNGVTYDVTINASAVQFNFRAAKGPLVTGMYTKIKVDAAKSPYDLLEVIQTSAFFKNKKGNDGKEVSEFVEQDSKIRNERSGWTNPQARSRGVGIDVPDSRNEPFYGDGRNLNPGVKGLIPLEMWDAPGFFNDQFLNKDVGLGMAFTTAIIGKKGAQNPTYDYIGAVTWYFYDFPGGSQFISVQKKAVEGVPTSLVDALNRWNSLPGNENVKVSGLNK